MHQKKIFKLQLTVGKCIFVNLLLCKHKFSVVVLGAFIKTNICVYNFSPFNGVTQPASTLSISTAISQVDHEGMNKQLAKYKWVGGGMFGGARVHAVAILQSFCAPHSQLFFCMLLLHDFSRYRNLKIESLQAGQSTHNNHKSDLKNLILLGYYNNKDKNVTVR